MPDVTEDVDRDQPAQLDDIAEKSQDETKDGKPYAPDFSNLSEERVSQLRSVCTAMDMRDQWARMIELIRCTLRRYFFIGIQHPYWNADAGQFQVGPSGGTLGGESDLNEEEMFEEEFNIFTGYGKIFMAVFSQNAAPVRMKPANPTKGDSVKATKEAEKYVDVYQQFNPPKCSQMDVARLMFTDGRVMARTKYAIDEEKCGVDDDGNPMGAEFTDFGGVLEWKVPIIGKFSSWPYAKHSRDIDITVAKEENPDAGLPDKIDAGAKGMLPNNEIARMSRIAVGEGIAQVSSDTLAYLVTEDTWWLRRSAFRHLPKDQQAFWIGQKANDTQDEVPGIFPKGCRAKFVGTIFCEAHPVSMDEEVRCMHAMPGDGNARPSMSDAMVPVQMEFNDAMGMLSQLYHKCIPSTYLNVGVEQMAAITEQSSRWGEFRALQPQNGLPLSDNIFQEVGMDVPASMEPWLTNLQGPLAQQLLNIQPAMFGGNMEDQKTAKAYQKAKDMSLGVMAIVWVPYLEFAAGIAWQAARLAGKRDQDTISAAIPLTDDKTKLIEIDVGVLRRGGFLCAPVSDTSFPESPADVANKWLALYQAAEANPMGLSAQILTEPDNRVGLKNAIGVDLVMPGAQARDRQLAEWELMQPQKGGDGPIPDADATQKQDQAKQQQAQQMAETIAPGTQAPPVPPGPEVKKPSVPTRIGDDHIEHARTCRRILESDEVWDMIDNQSDVVEDLILHMTEHLTKAQAAGLVIPPDLAGIIPPPPMPPPGAMPPAAAPGVAGPPAGAAKLPHAPKPGAGAPPAGPLAPPTPPGGINAAIPA